MKINRWLLGGFALSCILAILIPRLNNRTATDARPHSTVKNLPAAIPVATSVAAAVKEIRWWHPNVAISWQWQLVEPIDFSVKADVYDIDYEKNSAETVKRLHEQGRKVICYVNVGAAEGYRLDSADFPASVVGAVYDGYPDERWLDIRQISELAPVLQKRFDICQDKGFDAIEPDNDNGFGNNTGFPLTGDDQIRFNTWFADQAHLRGMAAVLKNDNEQAIQLAPHFDMAITEDCFNQGWCTEMNVFTRAGKPVFAAEYTDTKITTREFCPQAHALSINAILKHRELDTFRAACD